MRSTWNPSRRDILALTGLGAVGALVAACGGPSTSGGGNQQAGGGTSVDWASVEPAKEITWWSNHPGQSKAVEEQFIAAFTKETGIKVNLVTAGASYDEVAQRFQAASAGNDLPDLVIASDVWWFRYQINGQIIPVDEVFKALKVDTGDFVETLYNDYSYGEQHWAAPYARSTPLFYYNKEKWAQAGLPDRGPQTWQELAEWAPKLAPTVPADGAALGLATGTSWAAWWFSNILWGQGGAYSKDWKITLDTPEAQAASTFLKDMFNGPDKFASVGSSSDGPDFAGGVFACTVASTGSLTGLLESANFELGTAFLPEGPKGPGTPTGGTGLAIPAKRPPESQLAAAQFLAFLTNAENTATFSTSTGYMPVRTSAIEGPVMAEVYKTTPQFRTSVDQLTSKTRSQDWARAFIPGGDKILTDGIERIVLKNEDPSAVWPGVTTELEKAYQENVEPYL